MRSLVSVCVLCVVASLSAGELPKVRGNVVLSDRESATFFEIQRDGRVHVYDPFLQEQTDATNYERRVTSVPVKDRAWRWREGYLPVLEIGDDVELFARDDTLFVRQGSEFTAWPEGRKTDKAEFVASRQAVVGKWQEWFAAGRQLPLLDSRTACACKASLVQGLCLFAGKHPVYGAGHYRTFIHDAFPPATIAMCDTLVLYGHPAEAADVLTHYLDRFLLADGEIDYYGPSLAEYGGFMWVSAMVMDAAPARAAEIAARLKPLVKAVLRRFNYNGSSGRLGPHNLLSGSPEADMSRARDEYYHNNCHVLLGLRMAAPRYRAVGDTVFADELAKYARMLERMIASAYAAKRASLGGVPYSEGQSRLFDDIQSDIHATYANYRYYPELLETGWLSDEDAAWLVKYRETHNGETNGMTLFSPKGWGSRADNWPIASYARGLLEYGMRDRFDRVMRAMLDNYLTDDTFTAYEQVFNEGDPRRPGAPACVPAQLAFPRMLAWSMDYTPWNSQARRPSYDDPYDLNRSGCRIAVMANCDSETLSRRIFDKAQIVPFDDLRSAVWQLMAEKVDGLVFDEHVLRLMQWKHPGRFRILEQPVDTDPSVIGVAKSRTDVRDQLNRFIAESRANGLYDEMFLRWCHDPERRPEDAPDLSNVICRDPSARLLRVGIDPVQEPNAYYDRNGRLLGYDVEFACRFGRAANYRISFVADSEKALLQKLQAGELDVVIANLGKDASLPGVLWTEGYLDADIMMMVKEK